MHPRPVPILALLAVALPAAAEDYESAFRVYKEWVRRPSLHKRTLARERLAATDDIRALEQLMRDYARPERPRAQNRYLIAAIVGDRFAGPRAVEVFARWRASHDDRRDAWLWYLTLIAHYEERGADDLKAIAMGDEDVFLRAAAVEALRFHEADGLLEFVPAMVERLPREPVARAVLTESLVAALATLKRERATASFQKAAVPLVRLMDERETLDRTRIVMARYLMRIFETGFAWRDGKRWLHEMKVARSGGKVSSAEGYARPKFAGIEATGDRVVYVIDLSDSMMTPLTAREKAKLPKGPVSGTSVKARRKAGESDAWKTAFEGVKWGKVGNRFEAARELLKTSLLLLDEDKSFAVIWFGDQANPLRSTKGLRHATLSNVKRTISELDSIRPGPKKDDRPHGTLRGKTNLHGGIHRAFKMRSGRMVGDDEYVDPDTWTEGCDTIFVLSDGAATWDDWPATDRRDKGDTAGDPESGTRRQNTETREFAGPYRRAVHLFADVRRLNLFRKVEIHCVGMGEANMNLLDRVAALGHGEAIRIGEPAPKK